MSTLVLTDTPVFLLFYTKVFHVNTSYSVGQTW